MFDYERLLPLISLDGSSVEVRQIVEKDLNEVNDLLNKYLSFGISSVETLRNYMQDDNVTFSIVVVDDEIIALCKTTMSDVDSEHFIKYYKEVDREFLKSHDVTKVQTVDLCVTVPEYRDKGLMNHLVTEHKVDGVPQYTTSWCMEPEKINHLVEKYEVTNVIEEYFLEDKLPCPLCEGYCKCSVVQILLK